MGVGLDSPSEYLFRSGIPSGGAGTLSDGAFTNCFAGVWVYRDSSEITRSNTQQSAFVYFASAVRNVALAFDNAGSTLADLNLQIVYNSGGGAGTPAVFTGHAGDDFLDEWMYYFIVDNATDGQIAGYIRLADPTNPVFLSRTNDNAGSQYINELAFGDAAGWYAYARAVYGTGMDETDAVAYAASDVAEAGDWGFWPLVDNADTGDDSGNGRDLTFNGTLTSESSPTLGGGVPAAVLATLQYRLRRAA